MNSRESKNRETLKREREGESISVFGASLRERKEEKNIKGK